MWTVVLTSLALSTTIVSLPCVFVSLCVCQTDRNGGFISITTRDSVASPVLCVCVCVCVHCSAGNRNSAALLHDNEFVTGCRVSCGVDKKKDRKYRRVDHFNYYHQSTYSNVFITDTLFINGQLMLVK